MANFCSRKWFIHERFLEISRLFIFFLILILSLNFFVHSIFAYTGFKLIIFSILSYLGLFCYIFYLISKFLDILTVTKKLIIQIKNKLFNTIQDESSSKKTTKLKAFVENITAFLVSIAGLGVATKAIIEPLINIIKSLFAS